MNLNEAAVNLGPLVDHGSQANDTIAQFEAFGGYKQSGNAKDKCFDSLLSCTNSKAVWFRLN